MASHTTLTADEAKAPASVHPAVSPDPRTPSRPEVQELVDVEFSRYREMREQVRKQFTHVRRSVIAKYPN